MRYQDKKICIIDYGIGNVGSLLNMLKRLGIDAHISSNLTDIKDASHLILAGVGAFDAAMNSLRNSGMLETIEEQVIKKKIPILGICVGMHMLTESSEEGIETGLRWLPARTKSFINTLQDSTLRIPHMGWNTIKPCEGSVLLEQDKSQRFYFAHSYYVECLSEEFQTGTVKYGIGFAAVIEKGNIFAVQFHPEKSHKFGFRLFERFFQYS